MMTCNEFLEDTIFNPGFTQDDLSELLATYTDALASDISITERRVCIVVCMAEAVQREMLSPSFVKYVSEHLSSADLLA